ncbi:MAG: hypothetical protein ABTQ34_08245 [Bdellovibrionales bacterium]
MHEPKNSGRTIWSKINLAWKLSYYEVAALKHHCSYYKFSAKLALHRASISQASKRDSNLVLPQGSALFAQAAIAKKLVKKCKHEQDYLLTGRYYWFTHDRFAAASKLCDLSPDGEEKMNDAQALTFRFITAELPDHALESLKEGVKLLREARALNRMMDQLKSAILRL